MSRSPDQARHHAEQTSKAMKRMTGYCDACGRGQNPRVYFDPIIARALWVCRYCKHTHMKEGIAA